jgi:hypothetical protein
MPFIRVFIAGLVSLYHMHDIGLQSPERVA